MEEIWRTIEGYPNYMVSNMGRVKSLNYNKTSEEKILKVSKNRYGYLVVTLCKNGKRITRTIHSLVANSFIPNLENKPCIDHINTDKIDNRVENLRWATHKENMNNPLTYKKIKYSGKNLSNYNRKGKINPNSKSVLQLTKNYELIKKWDCLKDIERELGFSTGQICGACNGKYKMAKGYCWGYADDYEKIKFNVFDLEIYEKKVV